jgi:hypothetical protein
MSCPQFAQDLSARCLPQTRARVLVVCVQASYLILAARLSGLDVGPMSNKNIGKAAPI